MSQDKNLTIRRIVSSSRNLAFSTLTSRILGFVREILTAQFIGGGAIMDGWSLTKKIAVIFRRLLGEGELGKAIVPFISTSLKEEGPERAKERFLAILIWATMLLTALLLIICIPAYFLANHIQNNNWHIALQLMPLIMPYSLFICLVGIIASYLNSMKEYFLPSLTAILENIIMIGALYFFCSKLEGISQLKALSLSIVGAGLLEVFFMVLLLKRHNILKKILSPSVIRDTDTISKIWKMILPGFIAVSALQLSSLCDQLIASLLKTGSASAIYFSDRLYQLPVAVFAVSFATVANTEMSRASAAQDHAQFTEIFSRTLKTLIFVALPSAAFLGSFSKEIIEFVFQHGKFDAEATAMTWYPLTIYAAGIPFFCAYKVIAMSFTARRHMTTPCYVSIFCIVLNLVLNVVLMRPFQQGGIALATVLSSMTNNFILVYLYNKEMPDNRLEIVPIIVFTLKMIFISSVPIIPGWLIVNSPIDIHINNYLALGLAAVLYGGIFIILAKLFRFQEIDIVLSKLAKRR